MLEVRALTKNFESLRALDSVDLTIKKGEFFALLGPSGSGKTTLLRTIGGFESPDSGDIWFESRSVLRLEPHLRNFNTVFQRYALFPHLSVYENIAFGLKVKKVKAENVKKRAMAMLDLVQLPDFADRKIQTLSGGQQQRVALARALVNEPKVLLLDEPLSALDLKLRQAMQVELHALQRKVGITFIFVTHDQEEAMALSDRVAVMNHGRIEQVAAPADIYLKPKTSFVARFIGTMNEYNGAFIRPEHCHLTPLISDVPVINSDSIRKFNFEITDFFFHGQTWEFIGRTIEMGLSFRITLTTDRLVSETEKFKVGSKAILFWNVSDEVRL